MGLEAGRARACACSTRCCRPSSRPDGLGARRLRLRGRARRASSASPSAARWDRAPCRWCAPPRSGDIPWIRLNEQSLVQLGHGKYQQRIQATVTSRTPHIAVELASDKEETNQILANLGLPVPRQRLVQRADDAVAAAERARLPGRRQAAQRQPRPRASRSTSSTDEQVRTAFEEAREHSRSVIVETFITGDDHRMLVVNGELVAVAKRVPGHVVGRRRAHDRRAGGRGEPATRGAASATRRC